ncbi:MAG: TIGR00730 family Rossman fold protein [Desulfohalobiaceae bacterium]
MNSLCIFCGSSFGGRPEYGRAARDLALALVGQGVTIVYGGAAMGLMGVLADTAMGAGGRVVGVIPRALKDHEVAHTGLSELHLVGSMHERKARMADLADGFVALPGGAGTLEEIFEVWTWVQIGLHTKPCGLLNVAGYYDGLLDQLQRMEQDGFIRPAYRRALVVESDIEALLGRFRSYAPPPDKWGDLPGNAPGSLTP